MDDNLKPYVKEIFVEAKKSKNFQTYTAGVLLALTGHENETDVEELQRYWQAKCRAKVIEQIKLDSKQR